MSNIKQERKTTSANSYFKNVNNQLLTKEQEVKYCRQVAEGSGWAKNKLVLHNLRLVASVAKNYQNRGCDLEDLIQEGNIGLMKGIEKFDVERGHKLSTYVTWWIRQRIDRYIHNHGKVVRLPVHVQSLASKMKKVINDYRKEFNTDPNIEEICQVLEGLDCKITPEIAKAAFQSMMPNQVMQMDHSPNSASPEDSMHSYIEDSTIANPIDFMSQNDIIKVVKSEIEKLPIRDEKIIRLRFGISEDPTDSDSFPITEDEMEVLKNRKNETL